MEFQELNEFKKDLKRLAKRYRSLPEDLEVLKKVIEAFPDGNPPISYPIPNLHIETCIVKVKKIACKSLKGKGSNTGLRLIYAYLKEKEHIILIELYHKNDQSIENRKRITKYFKKLP